MNITEKTRLYHRVLDSATFNAVEDKAVEEQLELAYEILCIVGLDFIAETLSEFEDKAVFEPQLDSVEKYIDEMADSIITMEQATGEYDLLKRINNRVDFKLIKLEQRYLEGTLMDGIGYSN